MLFKITSLIFTTFLLTFSLHSTHTTTPIKHVVVIIQENRPFDHYFGTYPHAENKHGETKFYAKDNTPRVNGLSRATLNNNQNQANPFRISPKQGATNPSNPAHAYTILQNDCHAGLMDSFVQNSGQTCIPHTFVMGYYDGNTVTALWNYAQHFAMSDNFHSTCLAASTVGALNIVSGQTHGAIPANLNKGPTPVVIDATIMNDVDPTYDRCSVGPTAELTGINVGNLLNKKKVTWGWFQGGFRDCSKTHNGPIGPVVDYVPHHNPFQYYRSTSNPQHLPPSSTKKIGKTDRANHQYDLQDFWRGAKKGNLPSVSFLKARAFQNGHGGNSSPFLEQNFLVETINFLQKLPQWKDMAIIITYDDSGGWYDHVMAPIINQSQTSADTLVSPGNAGSNTPFGGYQARLGYGLRLPCIVISPWAKKNYVDHKMIDQTSILRFIEDNWDLGRIGDFSFDSLAGSMQNLFDFEEREFRRLILNPKTGAPKN